jgi:FkbM family methyltransferase
MGMNLTGMIRPIYRFVFCRRSAYRFNRMIHGLCLSGIGVGNYEDSRWTGERDMIQRLSRAYPAPTVLDVGAHDGLYSMELVRYSPRARVFAFEPHPETFRRLAANLTVVQSYEAGNGRRERCTAVNAAVSDRTGVEILHDRVSAHGSQHASLVPHVIDTIHQAEEKAFSVDCIALDAFIDQNHEEIAHIDLLKIDTEGSEMKVLQGAKHAILSHSIDLIQLEFNSMNVLSRVFMRDYRDILQGYSPYRLFPDGPAAFGPYNTIHEEIFGFQNVLFVSEKAPLRVREVITQ